MRDHNKGIFLRIYRFQKFSNLPHGIHIKSAIYLIKNDIFRLEKLNLKDFNFPFFSTTKPYIQVPPEKSFFNL